MGRAPAVGGWCAVKVSALLGYRGPASSSLVNYRPYKDVVYQGPLASTTRTADTSPAPTCLALSRAADGAAVSIAQGAC